MVVALEGDVLWDVPSADLCARVDVLFLFSLIPSTFVNSDFCPSQA